jgi:hypothetical protein
MSQYLPITAINDPEARLYATELSYLTFTLEFQESCIDVSETMVSIMISKLSYMLHPPSSTPKTLSPFHDISPNDLRALIAAEQANHAYLKARWRELQKIVERQLAKFEGWKREPGRLTATRFLEMIRDWVEVRKIIAGLLEESSAEGVVEKAFRETSTAMERAESQFARLCIGLKLTEGSSG